MIVAFQTFKPLTSSQYDLPPQATLSKNLEEVRFDLFNTAPTYADESKTNKKRLSSRKIQLTWTQEEIATERPSKAQPITPTTPLKAQSRKRIKITDEQTSIPFGEAIPLKLTKYAPGITSIPPTKISRLCKTQETETKGNVPCYTNESSHRLVTPQKQAIPSAQKLASYPVKAFSPGTQQTFRAYFQKHHIIPKSIWKKFEKQLSDLGFGRDRIENLVSLPTVRKISEKIAGLITPSSAKTLKERAEASAIHTGRHTEEYTKSIAESLENILNKTETTDDQKGKSILDFMSSTRRKLLNGTIQLNNAKSYGIKYTTYKRNKEFKYIKSYFHVHHLIPQNLFTEDIELFKECEKLSTFRQAFEFLGFENQHFLENLSSLPIASYQPKDVETTQTPMKGRASIGRSPHSGSHPNYNAEIEERLNEIFTPLRKAISSKNAIEINAEKESTKSRIFEFLDETKDVLYNCGKVLN